MTVFNIKQKLLHKLGNSLAKLIQYNCREDNTNIA